MLLAALDEGRAPDARKLLWLADIAVFRTTLTPFQCAGMLLILAALLANRAGKPVP